MRLRERYDWIVLGDHPGALLSAALAARLGLMTLVLPLAPGWKTTTAADGTVLDPEPNFVAGLGTVSGTNGLLRELLEQLGIGADERGKIRPAGVRKDADGGAGLGTIQVMTPSARIDLDLAYERLAAEFRRELGAHEGELAGELAGALRPFDAEVAAFWLRLPERMASAKSGGTPPSPLQGWGDLRKRVPRDPRNAAPRIDELFRGIWSGAHGGGGSRPGWADVAHAFVLARTGGAYEGGQTALRELLKGLAERHGAQVPAEVECRRIFVENGRFVGAQASGGGNRIDAAGCVLGCSLAQAAEIVAIGGRNLLKQLRKAPAPAGWRFTLALTIHPEAVPPGAARRMIWQEGDAPMLELELAEPADYGMMGRRSGDPSRLLFLRTILPFGEESLQVSFQKRMAARMLRQAAQLLPFLEYHIVRVYPDFRHENGDAEMSEAFPFSNPDMIPENLRIPLAGGETAGGTAGGAGASAGVDGLFIATGEAYPELGSLGPTVAALEAVAWRAQQAGIAGPLTGGAKSVV